MKTPSRKKAWWKLNVVPVFNLPPSFLWDLARTLRRWYLQQTADGNYGKLDMEPQPPIILDADNCWNVSFWIRTSHRGQSNVQRLS